MIKRPRGGCKVIAMIAIVVVLVVIILLRLAGC